MKLLIDESGQTGCIKLTDDKNLSFYSQPTFANGGVFVKNDDEEQKKIDKYLLFKDKFGFSGEIKGSDLTTRKNNEALLYFVDNILDSDNFCINLYDKRFYISSLLCASLLGDSFKIAEPQSFYNLVSSLSYQKDDFYVEYLKFVENITSKNFNNYLNYLVNYDYKFLEDSNNFIKIKATEIIENNDEDAFVDDFMTFGWYDDSKLINVINLNSLCEFIFWFKECKGINNRDLYIIHDRIDEFKETFLNELKQFHIQLSFNEENIYNQSILLEIADNIASLFTHFFNKAKVLEFSKKMFEEENKWNLTIMAKLVNKIGRENIKYTIPIQDWSALLSVTEIFLSDNNSNKSIFVFNKLYQMYMRNIFDEIQDYASLFDDVIEILKE